LKGTGLAGLSGKAAGSRGARLRRVKRQPTYVFFLERRGSRNGMAFPAGLFVLYLKQILEGYMTFGERMKELLEQGAVVSKEFVVKAGEKAQDWGSRGLEASKEFASKAGAKAQELGEVGVLKLEIKQFEAQGRKLMGRLGTEVYSRFSEGGADHISRDEPAVGAILAEIAMVKEAIEKREEDLQKRKSASAQAGR
jgi:hypothetical protein